MPYVKPSNTPFKPTAEDLEYIARAQVIAKMYDIDAVILDRHSETVGHFHWRWRYKYPTRPFQIQIGPIVIKKSKRTVRSRSGYSRRKIVETSRPTKTLTFASGAGLYAAIRKLANLAIFDE